ncbi:Chromo domain-containing protein LHP1 [Toxocara canis]|uniref:Chromo domain-containing protein LHP1 n=1 Tax=Toxocara canis TaxID=6265 RepID=A0A0B2UW76_TOXCA|nr:Chromo domain-containing protein LHP1 [Toxocara canis]
MDKAAEMVKSSKAKKSKEGTPHTPKEPTRDEDQNKSLEDQEEEYVVEKILSKKVISGEDGGVFYLIKWKGYPVEESTWEPEENCESSRDMIRKFEQGEEKKRGKKRLSGSSGQAASRKSVRAGSSDASVFEDSANAKRGRAIAASSQEQSEDDGKPAEDVTHKEKAGDDDDVGGLKSTAGGLADAEMKKDSDVANKPTSSLQIQTSSSHEVTPSVCEQDVTNEDGDDSFTAADQQFRICQGVKVRSVLGIAGLGGAEGLKALVRYEDEKYEVVPTRLLHTMAPKPLLNFYESNLRFRSSQS